MKMEHVMVLSAGRLCRPHDRRGSFQHQVSRFLHANTTVQQHGWTRPPWSFFPASFDFTPIHDFQLSVLTVAFPVLPLRSHCLKPAHFAQLSDRDLFFSTAFSLVDLLLFKLYSFMFYTIIDNRIALETFLTVPFLGRT